LVFSPKLETSHEEKDKKNTSGARPSGTRTSKEVGDFRGGKESPK
jgi:hypothetical protein